MLSRLGNLIANLDASDWIALGLGLVAIAIAVLGYRRKVGLDIRGGYSSVSSVLCDDQYVSSVFLENYKDRTISIHAMYLQLGHGAFITLKEFEFKPLLLGPYESYREDFETIDRYVANMRVVDLNRLFESKRAKKRVILATSQGRYKVKKRIHHWSPVGRYFRNQCTVIAQAERFKHAGRPIGGNALYLLELKHASGDPDVVVLYPKDHTAYALRELQLTQKSMESAKALRSHLGKLQKTGKLPAEDFEVLDLETIRARHVPPPRDAEVFEVPVVGWWVYQFACRLATGRATRKMKRENAKRKKRRVQGN